MRRQGGHFNGSREATRSLWFRRAWFRPCTAVPRHGYEGCKPATGRRLGPGAVQWGHAEPCRHKQRPAPLLAMPMASGMHAHPLTASGAGLLASRETGAPPSLPARSVRAKQGFQSRRSAGNWRCHSGRMGPGPPEPKLDFPPSCLPLQQACRTPTNYRQWDRN